MEGCIGGKQITNYLFINRTPVREVINFGQCVGIFLHHSIETFWVKWPISSSPRKKLINRILFEKLFRKLCGKFGVKWHMDWLERRDARCSAWYTTGRLSEWLLHFSTECTAHYPLNNTYYCQRQYIYSYQRLHWLHSRSLSCQLLSITASPVGEHPTFEIYLLSTLQTMVFRYFNRIS